MQQHAQCAQQIPMRLQGALSAPAILASPDRVQGLARTVQRENSKMCQDLTHASAALSASMEQELVVPQRPSAWIVLWGHTREERVLPLAANAKQAEWQKRKGRTDASNVLKEKSLH